MTLTVGVLSIQGDVAENMRAARQAISDADSDGQVALVKRSSDISSLDAVILPGGESTTIGQLSLAGDTMAALADRIRAGMPALGICAGLILLSNTVTDRNLGKTEQPLMGILDVRLERNSFGRQKDSFEVMLSMDALGIPQFHGVFIRAPSISKVGPGVEVVATLDDRIVAVRQDHVMGTAFHPELTSDAAIHRLLIDAARR